MSDTNELVAIVNDKNEVIGALPRNEMRRKQLPHRAVYILVLNQKHELFVQKRTDTKDIYPGYYDIAAGGVVLSGESWEQAAKRELLEELGIQAEIITSLKNSKRPTPAQECLWSEAAKEGCRRQIHLQEGGYLPHGTNTFVPPSHSSTIFQGCLIPLFEFHHVTEDNDVWGMSYLCPHEGPFVLQAEEVAEGRFMKLQDIPEMAKQHPFTPDGLALFQRFMHHYTDRKIQALQGIEAPR